MYFWPFGMAFYQYQLSLLVNFWYMPQECSSIQRGMIMLQYIWEWDAKKSERDFFLLISCIVSYWFEEEKRRNTAIPCKFLLKYCFTAEIFFATSHWWNQSSCRRHGPPGNLSLTVESIQISYKHTSKQWKWSLQPPLFQPTKLDLLVLAATYIWPQDPVHWTVC